LTTLNGCPHRLAVNLVVGNGTFSVFTRASFLKHGAGWLDGGNDIAGMSAAATFDEARRLCGEQPKCVGFTFKGGEKKPSSNVNIWFKSVFQFNKGKANGEEWHSWMVDPLGADNECREDCRTNLRSDEEPDPFCILGLNPGASEDAVKKQYKELAKKYHPDKNQGDATAHIRFIEVSNAQDTLLDRTRRHQAEIVRARRGQREDHYKKNQYVTRLTKRLLHPLVYAEGNQQFWLLHLYTPGREEETVAFNRAARMLKDECLIHFGAVDCEATKFCSKISPNGKRSSYGELVLVLPAEGLVVPCSKEAHPTGELIVKFVRLFMPEAKPLHHLQNLRALPKPGLPWLIISTAETCAGCAAAQALLQRVETNNVNLGRLDCDEADASTMET